MLADFSATCRMIQGHRVSTVTMQRCHGSMKAATWSAQERGWVLIQLYGPSRVASWIWPVGCGLPILPQRVVHQLDVTTQCGEAQSGAGTFNEEASGLSRPREGGLAGLS